MIDRLTFETKLFLSCQKIGFKKIIKENSLILLLIEIEHKQGGIIRVVVLIVKRPPLTVKTEAEMFMDKFMFLSFSHMYSYMVMFDSLPHHHKFSDMQPIKTHCCCKLKMDFSGL